MEEANKEDVSQKEATEEQRPTFDSLWRGAVGGGFAAVVGGGIWGLITILTGRKVAIAALGVGILAGYAVVFFSGGRKSLPFRLIAVISSILGIFIAKYLAYFYFTRQYGGVAMFISPMDIFFGGLGMGMAGIIPKEKEIKG